MFTENDSSNLSNLQDIFCDKEDYLLFFKEALKLLRGSLEKRTSISSLVPEYIEVELSPSIASPRIHFPSGRTNFVVIQLPKLGNDSNENIRDHKLLFYSAIKGKIEFAIAEELSIRIKMLAQKNNNQSKKGK